MDAIKVPILAVGMATQNGRVYPREVVERAIAKLGSASLKVVPYEDDYHAALAGPQFGKASNLKIDDALSQVMADITFENMPKSLLPAISYGVMGTGVVDNGTVKDFAMTGVGIQVEPIKPSCGQIDS